MLKFLLAATPAALFFASPASAQEAQCLDATTTNGREHITVFVNGILNTEEQGLCSLGSLRRLIDADAQQSDFELFYNPSQMGVQGLANDTAELRLQASISDRAHDIAQNDSTILVRGTSARYNFVLGKLYSDKIRLGTYEGDVEEEVYARSFALYTYLKDLVADGKSITLVAHSQGNFYIEAAIAIMRYSGEDDIASRIRVVGVAPVSSTTPSGIYVSLEGDRAIGLHSVRSSDLRFFTVLPSNARGCVGRLISNTCQEVSRLSEIEWMTHGFSRVYLNPNILVEGISVRERIRDQVTRSRDTLMGRLEPGEVARATPQVATGNPYTVAVAARWDRNVFSVMFRAQEPSTSVSEYIWDFGDGDTESRATPTVSHTFNPDGTYRVTLTVRLRDGSSTVCTKTFIMDDGFSGRRYDSRQNQTPCE